MGVVRGLWNCKLLQTVNKKVLSAFTAINVWEKIVTASKVE